MNTTTTVRPKKVPLPSLKAFEDDELMEDCPLTGYPTGWFAALWSHELPVGKVVPVHYFGQDLVVWRSESGEPVVMDAACPHMGCNLAIGAVGHPLEHGGVVGETIQCPFHGWRFGTDGENVEIPFSKHLNKAKARVWPTREFYGRWILFWHDSLGREPMWEPIPIPELEQPDKWFIEHDDTGWMNWGDVRQPLVCSSENAVDAAHVLYVHGSNPKTSTVRQSEGPIWECDFTLTFRNTKGEDVAEGSIDMQHWGMGFMVHRLNGIRPTIQIYTPTPTDGWNCVLRGMAFAGREEGEETPPKIARRVVERQLHSATEDARIFATMRYIKKPPYAPEEAQNMWKMRRWMRQFYPMSKEDS